MHNRAHGLRLDHAIFNRPLDAGVELEPHEWEQEYDPRGTWLVQTGELGSGKGNDYGLVSDGHGFEDSPDCERIAGGINTKGPHAIAIGRQANLLQWGFYAPPSRMTDSARRAFLNAIVYMRQFDGHRPLVEKAARSRNWFAQYVASVRDLDTMEEDRRERYEEYLKGCFPEAVIAVHGLNADKLARWFEDNAEYVHAVDRYSLDIDRDLHGLKLSNRQPAFLDWLAATLHEVPTDERALRLAARYLGDHGTDAATALSWIRDHRDRAFFSDVGGYRWFANPHPPAGGDDEQR